MSAATARCERNAEDEDRQQQPTWCYPFHVSSCRRGWGWDPPGQLKVSPQRYRAIPLPKPGGGDTVHAATTLHSVVCSSSLTPDCVFNASAGNCQVAFVSAGCIVSGCSRRRLSCFGKRSQENAPRKKLVRPNFAAISGCDASLCAQECALEGNL